MFREKPSAHSKAVLDDSLFTVDTTSFHQHKLYYCTIALICHIVRVNSTSCVIQGPDQALAGTHQRLRDSMSGRAEAWFRSPTKQQQKNKQRVDYELRQPRLRAAWLIRAGLTRLS